MKNQLNLITIGRRIQRIRQSMDLTREQMCEKTNLTEHTYQRIEAGKIDMKVSSLLIICEALDISIHQLIAEKLIVHIKD